MDWDRPEPRRKRAGLRRVDWLAAVFIALAVGSLWGTAYDCLNLGMPAWMGAVLTLGVGVGCWVFERGSR
jgi:hypothetical protein